MNVLLKVNLLSFKLSLSHSTLYQDERTDLSRKLGHFDFTLLMRCLLQLDYALCDKIVGVILSQKPDVNITNKLGMTAL